MKIAFRLVFMLFSLAFFSCDSSQSHSSPKPTGDKQSRIIYLVDGKRTSKSEAQKEFEEGNIELRGAATDSRNALVHYGEKYRYGVFVLVSKNKENQQ
jgi:hypothetical protein